MFAIGRQWGANEVTESLETSFYKAKKCSFWLMRGSDKGPLQMPWNTSLVPIVTIRPAIESRFIVNELHTETSLKVKIPAHERSIDRSADGISLSIKSLSLSKTSTPPPTDHCTVGMITRLVPIKGLGMFIKMAAEVLKTHPECTFWLIGDGQAKADVESIINHFGEKVKKAIVLFGEKSHEDSIALLDQMDVYVHTCMVESFGLAPLEALARGIAVASFGTSGLSDYLTEKTSAVANELTHIGLSDAVLRLLENHHLRNEVRRNGWNYVQTEARSEHNVIRYAELFDVMMNI
eukprot:TRINITY_DN1451_c0_g1_i2.p1 TRINITY_DN1451_c0_g1~~TRINITY_DN1451_c0_g1_i2.p1  ORF type:complete len:317 (-),score=75.19 TRINITY_DN1451_c0_g1_i2:105-983(-)